MCGIIGIAGHRDVFPELHAGLMALQHRGQDAAGIVTFQGTFRTKKGLGMVSQVFGERHLPRLTGSMGLGHVRYATQGSNEELDAQPMAVNYPLGVAMVHNGNVTNFHELRRSLYQDNHRLVETTCDVELILYALAAELETKNLSNLSVDELFECVAAVQRKVQGAYSVIALIANVGMIAFTDPHGIRPLVMGRRFCDEGLAWAFASETNVFDYLGFESIGDPAAGEAVFVDLDRRVHRRVCARERPAFCVFEYIYFALEDSVLHGRTVAGERVRMSRGLAATFRRTGLAPDIVIDVPSSSYFFASGMAEALGVPYRRGLVKNPHMGRSFINPTQEGRERVVRQKLNPIRDVVQGKKVAVVDDSIVRGTTARHLVRLLKEAGAQEVYFVSASPPFRHPCVFGIDMSIKREMIAANYPVEQIARYMGAEAVVYQTLEDLQALYQDLPCCFACFSGQYPTNLTDHELEAIEQERVCSKNK
ncbi:MAG: amidophosphoribosyltransferase [Pseudomonadota bacterium]